jgi:hypothetical protein
MSFRRYHAKYKDEIALNDSLNFYILNMSKLYGGHNTVGAQLAHLHPPEAVLKSEYSEPVGSDEVKKNLSTLHSS